MTAQREQLEANVDAHIESAKERALEAYGHATRQAMLRVGDPWRPIAEAIAFCGVLIADHTGKRFRTWGHCGPEWTDDAMQATWFVRRADAERECLTDEDGCFILAVNDVLAEALGVTE